MTADISYSPPCSDYESIPSVAAVESKGTIDNVNLQGSKDQETADLSMKDTKIDQLLKHKPHEEVRSQVAQAFGKELEAIIERKDKDLQELTSVKEKEPVRAGIPEATIQEALKNLMKRMKST
ncbi:hypothetical protein FEM48_ZijujUnG0079200 [Ziziphus jujuba var. spinosa]|uniref:Uncharacterized protein n=1 Tax=Ziziphus jujuba var. spinosa TaxID=714518 RepID=A0A978U8Q1_ZIZJJ|nr:hypothetical protein FEM48_ZijujUnG0079200 [Ziziphus jujuba var. spinosa]